MNRVRYYRLQLGLTQAGLAAVIGVQPGTLSHLENGTRNASGKMMVRVAHALRRTVTEVFFNEDTEAPAQQNTEANALITRNNVRGFLDKDGTAYLNLEDVVRGLGFTETKNGKEYVMWRRVSKYLSEFGFSALVPKESCPQIGVATSCNNMSYQEMCPEFIPENIFYKLCFKAKNAIARTFQDLVTDEILPTIRKTGSYSVSAVPTNGYIEERLQRIETKLDASYALREKHTQYEAVENTDEWLAALPDILTVSDIQHYLGVSYSRAEMIVKRPGFPVRLVGGKYLTIKTAFIEWLEETTRYGIYARRQTRAITK